MDVYEKSMSEQEMLTALREYAKAEGGFLWHVRDARGQNVEGMPDTIILIPRSFAHPGVAAFFEIKTQRDKASVLQQQVIFVAGTITEVAAGIIRPVPKHPTEITLDEALELLGWQEPEGL
jgi:hypothetical protein